MPKRARTRKAKAVPDVFFASFENHNEHEGETWTYFVKCKRDDFEGDIGADEVCSLLWKWLPHRDNSWTFEGLIENHEADTLVDHARDQGYMPSHMFAGDESTQFSRTGLIALMLDESQNDEPLWYKQEPSISAPKCTRYQQLLLALFYGGSFRAPFYGRSYDDDKEPLDPVLAAIATRCDCMKHADTATTDADADAASVVSSDSARSGCAYGCACNKLAESWLAHELFFCILRACLEPDMRSVDSIKWTPADAARKALRDWRALRSAFLEPDVASSSAYAPSSAAATSATSCASATPSVSLVVTSTGTFSDMATGIVKMLLIRSFPPMLLADLLAWTLFASHVEVKPVWKELCVALRTKLQPAMSDADFVNAMQKTKDGSHMLAKAWLKFPFNEDTFWPTCLDSVSCLTALAKERPQMLDTLPLRTKPSFVLTGDVAKDAIAMNEVEETYNWDTNKKLKDVGRWASIWNAEAKAYNLHVFVWNWAVFYAAGAYWRTCHPSEFALRVLALHKDDIANDAAPPEYRKVCMPDFFSTHGTLDYLGCRHQACRSHLLDEALQRGSKRKATSSWLLLVPTTTKSVDAWLDEFGRAEAGTGRGAESHQVRAARVAGALLLS